MFNINQKISTRFATKNHSIISRIRKVVALSGFLALTSCMSAFASDSENKQPAVLSPCISTAEQLEAYLYQQFPFPKDPSVNGNKVGSFAALLPQDIFNLIASKLTPDDLYNLCLQDKATCMAVGRELETMLPLFFQGLQRDYMGYKIINVDGRNHVVAVNNPVFLPEKDGYRESMQGEDLTVITAVYQFVKPMLIVANRMKDKEGRLLFGNLGLTAASLLSQKPQQISVCGHFSKSVTINYKVYDPMMGGRQDISDTRKILREEALSYLSALCLNACPGNTDSELYDITHKVLADLHMGSLCTYNHVRQAGKHLLEVGDTAYFKHDYFENIARQLLAGPHITINFGPAEGGNQFIYFDPEYKRTHEEKVADFDLLCQLFQKKCELGYTTTILPELWEHNRIKSAYLALLPFLTSPKQAEIFKKRHIDQVMK